jgi:poly-gamma-glutamate capsule biosynthesis protein CapA/YwtB (metallophosphatase superfamily)
MGAKTLTMLAVGDLILNTSEPEPLFALVAPVLKSADVIVGQVEVVFTRRGIPTWVEGIKMPPAVPCDPANINALSTAGFNVITLAGNHVCDSGVPGIKDTIAGLRNQGIAFVGAGMNIDEARRPAVIERDGTRFGFLNYNCVGPSGTWATPIKPGCAYVQIIEHYEQTNYSNPGGPPTAYTFIEPRSLETMVNDIHKLRPLCDILVVGLHKGIVFVAPKILAMYEQPISHAAIDAGADLVLGHHQHMLKGVELYKGKVIFHGLNHFVNAPPQLEGHKANERLPLRVVKKIRGESIDFEDPKFVFLEDERHQCIIAKCMIKGGQISRVSFLPCLINEQLQPEILKKNDERGQKIFDFMDQITKGAGLNGRFEWEGDEVVVHTG